MLLFCLYSLSNLAAICLFTRPMLRKNGNQFTSHGYPFYRVFNITVCGGQDAISQCYNNFSEGHDDEVKPNNVSQTVKCLTNSAMFDKHYSVSQTPQCLTKLVFNKHCNV